MLDYQKGKIYKIVCNITGLTYYGSTVNTLCKRMSGHRSHLNTENTCKSKLVLAGGDYDYSLVEECPCDSKDQLHQRERFYIENNECVNKTIPGRTKKEYCEQNRDKFLARDKEYREQNKDKIKERYEQNKDKILAYQKEHYEQNRDKLLAQNKEYRERNKDKIKEYREQNRDKLLAQKKIKVTCECGAVVNKSKLARHCKTKKHRDYLESQK